MASSTPQSSTSDAITNKQYDKLMTKITVMEKRLEKLEKLDKLDTVEHTVKEMEQKWIRSIKMIIMIIKP